MWFGPGGSHKTDLPVQFRWHFETSSMITDTPAPDPQRSTAARPRMTRNNAIGASLAWHGRHSGGAQNSCINVSSSCVAPPPPFRIPARHPAAEWGAEQIICPLVDLLVSPPVPVSVSATPDDFPFQAEVLRIVDSPLGTEQYQDCCQSVNKLPRSQESVGFIFRLSPVPWKHKTQVRGMGDCRINLL